MEKIIDFSKKKLFIKRIIKIYFCNVNGPDGSLPITD